MSSKRTKRGRRERFRAAALRTWEPLELVFRLRPLSDRCRQRCGGSGWLDCWCGMCGDEECFGCSDCLDDEREYDESSLDDDRDDDFDGADDFYEPAWATDGAG